MNPNFKRLNWPRTTPENERMAVTTPSVEPAKSWEAVWARNASPLLPARWISSNVCIRGGPGPSSAERKIQFVLSFGSSGARKCARCFVGRCQTAGRGHEPLRDASALDMCTGIITGTLQFGDINADLGGFAEFAPRRPWAVLPQKYRVACGVATGAAAAVAGWVGRSRNVRDAKGWVRCPRDENGPP